MLPARSTSSATPLVQEGKVSKKEALAKATNQQALEMNFQGIFLDESRRILS